MGGYKKGDLVFYRKHSNITIVGVIIYHVNDDITALASVMGTMTYFKIKWLADDRPKGMSTWYTSKQLAYLQALDILLTQ